MSDFKWAETKAVLDPFIDVFDGLTQNEIEIFTICGDTRARWARRVSIKVDESSDLRAIIDKHVGNSLGERAEVFCRVIKQLAEELIGNRDRDLTRFAY